MNETDRLGVEADVEGRLGPGWAGSAAGAGWLLLSSLPGALPLPAPPRPPATTLLTTISLTLLAADMAPSDKS